MPRPSRDKEGVRDLWAIGWYEAVGNWMTWATRWYKGVDNPVIWSCKQLNTDTKLMIWNCGQPNDLKLLATWWYEQLEWYEWRRLDDMRLWKLYRALLNWTTYCIRMACKGSKTRCTCSHYLCLSSLKLPSIRCFWKIEVFFFLCHGVTYLVGPSS